MMWQVLFNKETEAILGVHIIGLHAADLIQECSNAVAAGTTVRELSMMVRETERDNLPHPAGFTGISQPASFCPFSVFLLPCSLFSCFFFPRFFFVAFVSGHYLSAYHFFL